MPRRVVFGSSAEGTGEPLDSVSTSLNRMPLLTPQLGADNGDPDMMAGTNNDSFALPQPMNTGDSDGSDTPEEVCLAAGVIPRTLLQAGRLLQGELVQDREDLVGLLFSVLYDQMAMSEHYASPRDRPSVAERIEGAVVMRRGLQRLVARYAWEAVDGRLASGGSLPSGRELERWVYETQQEFVEKSLGSDPVSTLR
eukprot:Hpha_TRINITY_DN15029_c5_g7::TRINITY_DN15029_c5_g7_i1::g.125572::m.125572